MQSKVPAGVAVSKAAPPLRETATERVAVLLSTLVQVSTREAAGNEAASDKAAESTLRASM